jgi:hypothetical protein
MKYITKIILILVLLSTFNCKYYHYSNENENTSLYFFHTFFFISHPGLHCRELYYTINEDATLPIKQKFCLFEYSKSPENNKLYEIHITADSEFYLRIHFDDDDEKEKFKYFYFRFNLGIGQRIETLGLMEMLYNRVKFTYHFTYIENDILSQASENKGFQVNFSPEEISYIPTGNVLSANIKTDSNDILGKEPRTKSFSLGKVFSKSNLSRSHDKTKPDAAIPVRRTQTKQVEKPKKPDRKRFSVTFKDKDEVKVVNNDISGFTIGIKDVTQISINELGPYGYFLIIYSTFPLINMHFTGNNYEKLFFINYCKLLKKISCKRVHCKLPEFWVESKRMPIRVKEYDNINGIAELWQMQ